MESLQQIEREEKKEEEAKKEIKKKDDVEMKRKMDELKVKLNDYTCT